MVKKNTNYIELNGKRYDSKTGELLRAHGSKAVQSAKTAQPIDDVRRVGPNHPVHIIKPVATVAAPAAAPPTHKTFSVARSEHHVKAHQPEHAKTLMRHAVKKPSASLKRHLIVSARTDILAKVPNLSVLPKLSIAAIDSARLKRAERIAQSKLIRRFAAFPATNFVAATPSSSAQLVVPKVIAPVHAHHAAAHTGTTRSMDIFQRALTHANAHEQPAVHPKKHVRATGKRRAMRGHRALGISAAVVATLLVVGFIGYQNTPNIMMRVAAARSGVHASLTGYKPSGFAVGKFSYSPGRVAVNFTGSDNRAYKVSAQTSNWDSETLRDTYVADNASGYQVFQAAGRTVYIYGNNDATWVNNGIWYQLTDNGSLSTNQVLQLAQSM